MSVVEVRELNKRYGKHKILKDVSFVIEEKEIVGFIGPNGAGKSTVMKCLSSLVYPDSGEIIINNYNLKKAREKALTSVSAMIENPGLFPALSGYENLVYFASLRNIEKARIDEIIEFTKLGDGIKKKVAHYSLGMKQRLGLGIALLSKPKFLILDEPTNGLDPKGIMELREELRELVDSEGISILISSHQLGEIEKISDRIICIDHGEIIETPQNLDSYDAYLVYFNEKDVDSAKNIQLQDAVVEWDDNVAKVHFNSDDGLSTYMEKLVENNIKIKEITRELVDIESVYKEAFGGNYVEKHQE